MTVWLSALHTRVLSYSTTFVANQSPAIVSCDSIQIMGYSDFYIQVYAWPNGWAPYLAPDILGSIPGGGLPLIGVGIGAEEMSLWKNMAKCLKPQADQFFGKLFNKQSIGSTIIKSYRKTHCCCWLKVSNPICIVV